MSNRANALAERLEQGARELAALALTLTDAEWQSRIPGDGRKIGGVVHHVAYMYPIEIDVARTIAAGTPITDVTWEVVADINANHAREHADVTREAALERLRENSHEAAEPQGRSATKNSIARRHSHSASWRR